MRIVEASFRDPSGHVVIDNNRVLRIIRNYYKEDWAQLKSSSLLKEAHNKGLLPFKELPREDWPSNVYDVDTIAILESTKLPFITYPYEWSFAQLKDAALLTLDLQLLALQHGFTLKDASAYNVQFYNGRPVFIDLLSFEKLCSGKPWEAYGQFCSHFLAPLALMSKCDPRFALLAKNWIDGIPLDMVCSMLPLSSRLSPGLAIHLHLHSSMRARHAETDGKKSKKQVHVSLEQLKNIINSLYKTITNLTPPKADTEWGKYYTETNYSALAMQAKQDIIQSMISNRTGQLALDLGANDGFFSRLLADRFNLVIAADIDHTAVNHNWINKKNPNILPMVLDMANPSPAIGWGCGERDDFFTRCSADLVMVLALCHHLRITANIPVRKISQALAKLVGSKGELLLEYVPKTDSQVKRLLAGREDIFSDYTLKDFMAAFKEEGMECIQSFDIPESERSLHLFQRAAT